MAKTPSAAEPHVREPQSAVRTARRVVDDSARIGREGWTVAAKCKHETVGGAKADRPGYQALLEAAKRREFDVIVVEKVSRLWRDQEERWRTVKRQEFWGACAPGPLFRECES